MEVQMVKCKIHTSSPRRNRLPTHVGVFAPKEKLLFFCEEGQVDRLWIEMIVPSGTPGILILMPGTNNKNTAPLDMETISTLEVPDELREELLAAETPACRLMRSVQSILQAACN